MIDRENLRTTVYYDKWSGLWRAEVKLGIDPATGKRKVKKVSAKTEDKTRDKLKELLQELENNICSPAGYTIAQCLEEFLRDQIEDLAPGTQANYRQTTRTHITPYLGRHKLKEFRVADVSA